MVLRSRLQSLLLQSLHHISLIPPYTFAEVSQETELSESLQSDHSHCSGNASLLFVGVGIGTAFENFHFLQSSSSSLGLMGNHSSHCSPENSRWSFEVIWPMFSWVHIGVFVLELQILHSSIV